ncbi:VanZ family protein [Sanguibacter suarezii]|uniref:VanZ family protein n=1 Tax=Sanguibacter suarezii TaxID=60921 RepID=UPI00082E48F8|nr:VanZ family protein [Sanguibacter suarezii]
MLAAYTLGVLAVLAWPTPVDSSAAGPLTALTRWLAAHGFAWLTYSVIEFTANVALFVPIGLLVTLTSPRLRWWQVVGGAAVLSSLAEIAQATLRPERFGTVQDVLANTAGAALGFIAARYLQTRRTAPQDTPTT